MATRWFKTACCVTRIAMVPAHFGKARPRGPAAAELDRFLRAHRRRLPALLRASLLGGILAFIAYTSVLAFLAFQSPRLAGVLSVFLALVIIGGREPASLLAYQQLGEGAVLWVALVAVLGDVGIVLVGLPLYWWALERLRETRGFRGFLLDMERRSLENRHLVSRWGPVALVGFVFVPAWGTGPLVAAAAGLVARVPVKILLPVLIGAVAVVNVTWAVVLAHTHAALPAGGIWPFLPLGILLVIVTAAIVASVRSRRRHEVVLPLHDHALGQSERRGVLDQLGAREKRGLLYVDCNALQTRLGFPLGHMERCRSVAELLLLSSVAPADAALLHDVGLATIRDLAVAPPGLVSRVLAEAAPDANADWAARATAWQADAQAFAARTAD